MTSLRLLAMLLLLAMTTIHAANLRNGDDSSLPFRTVSGSGSDSSEHSSDNATQDWPSVSSVSQGSSESKNVIVEEEVDGVRAWAQCGGLYYLGKTKCQQHTFCKQLSEFISVCFPESRPTEKLLVSLAVAVAVATTAGAQDLAAETQPMWDHSGFSSSDSNSAADDTLDASSDSVTATLAPSSTAPVAQPIANGVTMFGQCGGIFYSGTTECYDPDAYCRQLSIYSSICSPKPAQ
ncbi:hypothetical protein JG687_00002217 [Phytophthora cactorum]|uniref:CBM1 domain-containing protein n=1 Tax=Phytophthora cactorum TaxID=29920 RepID=A0A8T1UVW3_9STRA|nr:hypothetical protein JG687_00002217 [Phytophthora cactorum]